MNNQNEMAGILHGKDVQNFALAGNATFTVVGNTSRFTYKIRQKKNPDGTRTPFFVSVLNGADNESSYRYIGCITTNNRKFYFGRKSRLDENAPSVKAFKWVWEHKNSPKLEQAEIWHEGICGRCGRKLTVPQSIESGIGPVCAKLATKY